METPKTMGGAAIAVRSEEPSLDLATVVACLADSIHSPTPDSPSPSSEIKHQPLLLFDFQRNVLTINPCAVLARLRQAKGHLRLGAQHEGFIRIPRTKAGSSNLVGARIAEGSEHDLAKATAVLAPAIDNELTRLFGSEEAVAGRLDAFVVDAKEAMGDLARRALGETVGTFALKDSLDAYTRIRPIFFERTDRKAGEGSEPVARVISSIEEIESEGIQRKFKAGLLGMFGGEEDEEELEDLVADCLHEFEKEGSPPNQLRQFLDNNALSRIRLAISIHIMDAIAAAASAKIREFEGKSTSSKTAQETLIALNLFCEYIRRVKQLYTTMVEEQSEDVQVEASRTYGVSGSFCLSEVMQSKGFYLCLPVWTDWMAQTLEARTSGQLSQLPAQLPAVLRAMSYHFKINGQDPSEEMPAFETRLKRIKEEIAPEPDEQGERSFGYAAKKRIAQLIMLAAVIPDADGKAVCALAKARAAAERIGSGGMDEVNQIIAELQAKSTQVQSLAEVFVRLLRGKKTRLVDSNSKKLTYYLCLNKSIINRNRFLTGASDFLAESDEVGFIRHLSISRDTVSRGSFLSVKVMVTLDDRWIYAEGETRQVPVRKDFSSRLVRLIMREMVSENAPQETAPWVREWQTRSGYIEVVYAPRWLGMSGSSKSTKDAGKSKQYLAAYRAAFLILAYVSLHVLLGRLKSASGQSFPVSLLRLQEKGREVKDHEADGFVYAAAQAIEHALGAKNPIRMQGISRPISTGEHARYAKRGALNGLLAGLPTFVGTDALTEEPIGIVSFATRPSDARPGIGAEEGQVFIGRTYLAKPVKGAQKGFQIEPGKNVFGVEFGDNVFKAPAGVLEAITGLREAGCRHILYLTHHYSGRHVGRAALYHRHHDNPKFLAFLQEKFADMRIYPVWREVFSATRLAERDKATEDGFEVDAWGDHIDAHMDLLLKRMLKASDLSSSNAIPIYTLATLHVVTGSLEASQEARPQSGFSSYFLVHGESGPAYAGYNVAAHENLMTFLKEENAPLKDALIAVLRGIHYAESETGTHAPVRDKNDPRHRMKFATPVLDPYPWIAPATIGGAGEITIEVSRRRRCVMSLTGILARMAQVMALVEGKRYRGRP